VEEGKGEEMLDNRFFYCLPCSTECLSLSDTFIAFFTYLFTYYGGVCDNCTFTSPLSNYVY